MSTSTSLQPLCVRIITLQFTSVSTALDTSVLRICSVAHLAANPVGKVELSDELLDYDYHGSSFQVAMTTVLVLALSAVS